MVEKIIALDFDGCMVYDTFPSKEFIPRTDIIHKAKMLSDMGHEFVLWTCREGTYLIDAICWITGNNLGINFISVNQDSMEVNQKCREYFDHPKMDYKHSRKINADYYIDDKSPGSMDWFLQWDGQ